MAQFDNKQRQHKRQKYYEEKQNELKNIISKIEEANSLKEIFKPEEYALPRGWAETVSKVLIKGNKKEGMNNNQLRKIFTQLKGIETQLKQNEEKFDKYKNNIFLIMPQVAYAFGRNVITKEFYNLMKACIKPNKIKAPKDYYCFVSFFTAIVAYFKAENAR